MSDADVEISSSVQFVRVDEDFVLMDVAAGLYFGLDPVASHVWQSLAEHGNLARAAETLCEVYDVEPEAALADIEKWVAELEAKRLVRRLQTVPAAAPGRPPRRRRSPPAG
jgi:hypothetical protein